MAYKVRLARKGTAGRKERAVKKAIKAQQVLQGPQDALAKLARQAAQV